jgi:hypothetical protein
VRHGKGRLPTASQPNKPLGDYIDHPRPRQRRRRHQLSPPQQLPEGRDPDLLSSHPPGRTPYRQRVVGTPTQKYPARRPAHATCRTCTTVLLVTYSSRQQQQHHRSNFSHHNPHPPPARNHDESGALGSLTLSLSCTPSRPTRLHCACRRPLCSSPPPTSPFPPLLGGRSVFGTVADVCFGKTPAAAAAADNDNDNPIVR